MKTDKLNIRQATWHDVEFLASTVLITNEERLSAEPGWNAEDFIDKVRAAIERDVQGKVKNSITSVIECYGEPIGRLRVVRSDDKIHVAGIQILPAFQQKGIGSTIMYKIMNEADKKTVPLTLEVEKNNPAAKRLYIRLGFKVVEDREDRELMVLHVGE